MGKGYDHTFVINGYDKDDAEGNMKYCATVFEPTSRRRMDVFTTEPGVQFYTGNWMHVVAGKKCKRGVSLAQRTGLCLETKHFPDCPNQPQFPSTVLAPLATYKSATVHRFSVGSPLRKPKWRNIKTMKPDSKNVNLKLKCVSCEKMASSWEVVAGDDSGIVKLLLRNSEQAELCKSGAGLRVQNARVVMVDGFIRLLIDKWAVLKADSESASMEVNSKNDVSAVEYELK